MTIYIARTANVTVDRCEGNGSIGKAVGEILG